MKNSENDRANTPNVRKHDLSRRQEKNRGMSAVWCELCPFLPSSELHTGLQVRDRRAGQNRAET